MRLYLKTKILINGLFPVNGYKIDGYIEKSIKYDESIIDSKSEEYIFYSSGYLLNGLASYKERKGYYYECFESEDYHIIDVDDSLDNERKARLVLEEQFKNIAFLEKKIRLLTGFGISLPVFKTDIYDENMNFITYCGGANWNTSNLRINDYTEEMKAILENRLCFHMADSIIKELETKNKRYERALYFYNKSFESIDIGIRFILLFSSLEALFNMRDGKITQEISSYSCKILFLNIEKEEEAKEKITEYYDIRSRYIHGNDGFLITKEIEDNLREYVREILLIYWNIALNYNIFNPKKIKKLIMSLNAKNLDLRVKLFVKYLRTPVKDFSILYKELRESIIKDDFNIL